MMTQSNLQTRVLIVAITLLCDTEVFPSCPADIRTLNFPTVHTVLSHLFEKYCAINKVCFIPAL